jgi:hypothetical protein
MALKEAMKKESWGSEEREGRREELLKLFIIETSVERFLADHI